MRRVIAGIARWFPPKFVADRLLPWGSIAIALGGVYWGISEYRNDIAIARVGTTLELHKRYLDTDLLENKIQLSRIQTDPIIRARCEFIETHIQSGDIEKIHYGELTCGSVDKETQRKLQPYDIVGDLREKLRDYIKREVGKNSLSGDDIKSLAQLSIFFKSIIVCTEQDNCDDETVVALFAREMVEFVNMTCPYEKKLNSGGKTDNLTIAKFLVAHDVHKNIYWSLDDHREKLFLCKEYRELESR